VCVCVCVCEIVSAVHPFDVRLGDRYNIRQRTPLRRHAFSSFRNRYSRTVQARCCAGYREVDKVCWLIAVVLMITTTSFEFLISIDQRSLRSLNSCAKSRLPACSKKERRAPGFRRVPQTPLHCYFLPWQYNCNCVLARPPALRPLPLPQNMH